MGNIRLRIEGEDAEALAASLAVFVKQEWGIDATSTPIKPQEAKAGDKDWVGITLGILGVVTNLPGFLNSKMVKSLAWRLGTKESLEKLIAFLEEQPPEQKANVYIENEDKQIKVGKKQLTEMLDEMQKDGFGVDE